MFSSIFRHLILYIIFYSFGAILAFSAISSATAVCGILPYLVCGRKGIFFDDKSSSESKFPN